MTNWNEIKRHVEDDKPFSRVPEGTVVVPVVGVSFVSGYPSNILLLQNIHRKSEGPLFVDLVRNPDNPYDKNAIEVHFSDVMLGHLPRDIAAMVAPILDAGNYVAASIYQVRISPDHIDNPGLDLLMDDWSR